MGGRVLSAECGEHPQHAGRQAGTRWGLGPRLRDGDWDPMNVSVEEAGDIVSVL